MYRATWIICWRYRNLFSGDVVCFATGTDYPDALAGGVFAAKHGAPMVLVHTSANTGSIRNFVEDLGAHTAYIFGSESVVSGDLIADCI